MSKSTLTETSHIEVKLPSERSFGIFFALVFGGLAAYWYYRGRSIELVVGVLVASVFFGLAAAFAPRSFRPLNKAWFRLGELLGKVVTPVMLGVIYFGLLTPVALVARLLGRDELKLRHREGSSYWVERSPPGPAGDTFKNQF